MSFATARDAMSACDAKLSCDSSVWPSPALRRTALYRGVAVHCEALETCDGWRLSVSSARYSLSVYSADMVIDALECVTA